MIELTWIPEAIRAVVWVYFTIGLIALLCALFIPKGWGKKAGWCVAVMVSWIWIPKSLAPPAPNPEQVAAKQQRLAQRDAAQARFKVLCATAGEKIDRTVEGVDGFLLMRMRPESTNHSSQFTMDDPYAQLLIRKANV